MAREASNTASRFNSAYILLGLWCGFMVSPLVFTGRTVTVTKETGLEPITNSTYPNEIEAHFKGKPLHVFDPRLLQMPEDGYCKDFSNKVSWRVFVCMGTQPESQP